MSDVGVLPAVVRFNDIGSKLDEASQSKVTFGVEFLDDALIGLLPTDLMIIGARPGVGKSQLATQIAGSNANFRRNVLFIALEAEPLEIEMRLTYQIVAGLFFKDTARPRNVEMNYRSWRFGRYKNELERYAVEARDIFTARYAQLNTFYRDRIFNAETLHQILEAEARNHDLVVVDHLHYFDLSGNNRNDALTVTVQKIRNLNLQHNVPIVLVAHLRKDVLSLTPDQDEFLGSGEIAKQATICAMIAKDTETSDYKNAIHSTLISVPKTRTGALGFVGSMKYSAKAQCYMPGYELGFVRRSGEKERFEPLPRADYPGWARRDP